MKLRLTRNTLVNGKHVEKGAVVDVDKRTALALLNAGKAAVVKNKSEQAAKSSGEEADKK